MQPDEPNAQDQIAFRPSRPSGALGLLFTQKRSATTPIRLTGHVGIVIALFGGVSDRRSYNRYRLTEAAEGTVRLFPDVIVEPYGEDQWIATGREAAVSGETLILDIVLRDADEGELRHRLPVCVIDSRPIILDGDMRHRIRLHSGTLAPAQFEQVRRR